MRTKPRAVLDAVVGAAFLGWMASAVFFSTTLRDTFPELTPRSAAATLIVAASVLAGATLGLQFRSTSVRTLRRTLSLVLLTFSAGSLFIGILTLQDRATYVKEVLYVGNEARDKGFVFLVFGAVALIGSVVLWFRPFSRERSQGSGAPPESRA